MAETLKLALASMESRCGNWRGNLAQMRDQITKAAAARAELLVFPELSLTGYCLHHNIVLPPNHAAFSELSALAVANKMTLLVGAALSRADEVTISQLVFAPDGAQLCYDKTHLGVRERNIFTPGKSLPVFPGKLPFGIALCYDAHFPEVASALESAGAGLILIPHAAPVCAGNRRALWQKYMPARAYDNRVFVACCNLVGENGCGETFAGGLCVYTPEGELLAEDFSSKPGLLFATLPLAQTARYRTEDTNGKYFPAARRYDLYERSLP